MALALTFIINQWYFPITWDIHSITTGVYWGVNIMIMITMWVFGRFAYSTRHGWSYHSWHVTDCSISSSDQALLRISESDMRLYEGSRDRWQMWYEVNGSTRCLPSDSIAIIQTFVLPLVKCLRQCYVSLWMKDKLKAVFIILMIHFLFTNEDYATRAGI